MKVKEIMTREVELAGPDDTLQEAAQRMLELDIGVLPVGEDDRLVGMITDRDVAVRGIAQGKGPSAKVREVMSAEVKYCFEDEDVSHVGKNMGSVQVRRLPVVSRDKRLVGILSLGDLATQGKPKAGMEALRGISEQSTQHSQSAETIA
jgi:CBS domain-containing protein